MTQTEALKLALEALEELNNTNSYWWQEVDEQTIKKIDPAITAIKEVLAQPEQCKYGQEPKSCTSSPMDCQCAIDATLAQPEQEPKSTTSMSPTSPKALQPEQEPFGYFRYDLRLDAWVQNREGRPGTPFYTTPPQRTWVGLTEKDMDWLHENTPCIEGNYGYRFIKAIEAKLKEKNT